MVEVGKVIVVAVDDDGSCIDGAAMITIRRLPTDHFSETKSQKAESE